MKALEFYDEKIGQWDFYRCQKCLGIFSSQQERVRLDRMRETDDRQMFVHCTSLKYKPTRPRAIEWIYPNVLIYSLKLLLARGYAPWARRHAVWTLPLVALLVSNRTTR